MDIKASLTKAGLVAGVAAAGTLLMGGGNVKMLSVEIPAFIGSGVVGGSASVLADVGHAYILPHIPVDKKWENLEAAALNFGLGAAGFAGLGKLTIEGVPNSALLRVGVFGGASVLAGDYAYNVYWNPNAQGILF